MKEKGFLNILSALLLSSALLVIASSTATYYSSLSAAANNLMEIESVSAQYDSTAYGYSRLLEEEQVIVTRDDNLYSFEEENLTLASSVYSVDAVNFYNFQQAKALIPPDVDINNVKRPKMFIRPLGIVVDHGTGTVSYTPPNASIGARVSSYDVGVIVDQQEVRLTWVERNTVSPGDANALTVHVAVQGSKGVRTQDETLDKYAYSELRAYGTANDLIATFVFDSPAKLVVNYEKDMYLKTIIGLDTNQAWVELGTNAVGISTDRVDNNGRIIILEN